MSYGVYFHHVKMERIHLPALSGPVLFDSAARLLAVVFTLAAIILAGRWLTELTAPRPVAELPSAAIAQPESGTGTISRLFGIGGNVQSQLLEGLQLTGVFTGSRGGGFATIHTRTGDLPVFPGEEVVPGVILKQIEGNRVILLISGIEKELKLREGTVQPAASSRQTVSNRQATAPPVAASRQTASNRSSRPVRAQEQ
jgi:hypothetical protein